MKIKPSYFICKFRGADGCYAVITAVDMCDKIGIHRSSQHKSLDIMSVYPMAFDTRNDADEVLEEIRYGDEELKSKFIEVKDKLHTCCKDYLRWNFKIVDLLSRYMKQEFIDESIKLALTNQPKQLMTLLDKLYWALPDSRCNIIEDPYGFSELLSIVDNDDYKQL